MKERNENNEKEERGEVKKRVGKKGIDIYAMSNMEKEIFQIAGEDGVKIFRIADGVTTTEEAPKILGISKEKFDETLEKLREKYIEIEREKRVEVVIEKKERLPPIALPYDKRSTFFSSFSLFNKFGPSGKKLFDLIDGKMDVIQLASKGELPLSSTDKVMEYLGEKKLVRFRKLNIDEIKKRYGKIGIDIYKEYGREGLLIYLLLEKYKNPIKALRISKVDRLVGISVCEYIYNLLSLKRPFSPRILRKILGR